MPIRLVGRGGASIGSRVPRPLPQGRHRGWREVAYLRLANHRLIPLSVEDYWNLGRLGAQALPTGAVAWLSVQPWSLRARIESLLRDQRGAIAADSATAGGGGGFPGSVSVGLNNAGGDAIWGFGCGYGGGGGTIASMSYASAGMTLDASVSGDTARSFYKAAPATGSNNLVCTQSGVTTSLNVVGITFSGVDQTTPLTHAGVGDEQTAAGASITQSTVSGAMLVLGVCVTTADFHVISGTGGSTKVVESTSPNDIVGLIEAATSTSQAIGAAWPVSDTYRACSGSLKEAAGGGAVTISPSGLTSELVFGTHVVSTPSAPSDFTTTGGGPHGYYAPSVTPPQVIRRF